MGLIGALACSGRVIGWKGKTPWNYPEELAYYRALTAGQPLIMGRKTFEAMPRHALEGRTNIVFSRTRYRSVLGEFVPSWGAFSRLGVSHGCMVGGGEIATLFLRKNAISVFYLTHIHAPYPGDVFFPVKMLQNWPREILFKNPHFTICRYENPRD